MRDCDESAFSSAAVHSGKWYFLFALYFLWVRVVFFAIVKLKSSHRKICINSRLDHDFMILKMNLGQQTPDITRLLRNTHSRYRPSNFSLVSLQQFLKYEYLSTQSPTYEAGVDLHKGDELSIAVSEAVMSTCVRSDWFTVHHRKCVLRTRHPLYTEKQNPSHKKRQS